MKGKTNGTEAKSSKAKKASQKDIAGSYNKFKMFEPNRLESKSLQLREKVNNSAAIFDFLKQIQTIIPLQLY